MIGNQAAMPSTYHIADPTQTRKEDLPHYEFISKADLHQESDFISRQSNSNKQKNKPAFGTTNSNSPLKRKTDG